MVPIYAYSFSHCSPNQVQVKTDTHNTISVVDGCGLPSILCLRDEEELGALMTTTTTTTTTLPCSTTIQGVVGSGYGGCSSTFFGSIVFVVTRWERTTSTPKHGRGLVEGSYSDKLSTRTHRLFVST